MMMMYVLVRGVNPAGDRGTRPQKCRTGGRQYVMSPKYGTDSAFVSAGE